MIVTNLAILLGVIGASVILAAVVKMYTFRRAAEGVHTLERNGRPTLIYFWTPNCAACRTSQTRIVDELAGEFDERVDIVRINAHDAPRQARKFGILTVPTTVVLGSDGVVHRVNTGVVDSSTLREQLGAA